MSDDESDPDTDSDDDGMGQDMRDALRCALMEGGHLVIVLLSEGAANEGLWSQVDLP